MPVDQSTLDAALGPGIGDDLQANRKQLAGLQGKRDQAETERATAEAEAAKIQGETAQAVNADRQKLAEFKPRESQLEQPKAPDFKSNEPSPQQMQQTAGMLMVVAGLMGAFSRQGYTAALNNMTAALQGFDEGNNEAAKKHLDEFHNQVTDFKTKLEALKEDRAALDKMDQHDIQAIQQQMEFDAHKNDLPLLAQTAKSKSLTEGLKSYDSHINEIQKAIDHAEMVAQRMQEARERHADRAATLAAQQGGGGGTPLTPEGEKVKEDLIRAGRPIPKTRRGEVDNDVLNHMGAGQAADPSAPPVSVSQADYAANKKSLSLLVPRADAIDQGMNKIAKDTVTLQSVMDAGAEPFGQFFNKPLNAIRTGASSEDLVGYKLAAKQVATEYERLLQGGQLSTAQLHQGAAEDAKSILNENMTPGEANKVLKMMLREMNNARESAHDQIEIVKHRMQGVTSPAPGAGKKLVYDPATGTFK